MSLGFCIKVEKEKWEEKKKRVEDKGMRDRNNESESDVIGLGVAVVVRAFERSRNAFRVRPYVAQRLMDKCPIWTPSATYFITFF